MPECKRQIKVVGKIQCIGFQHAAACAKDIALKHNDRLLEPVITGLLEFEWDEFIKRTIKDVRDEMWGFCGTAITFIGSQIIGNAEDFIKWAQAEFNYEEYRPTALYETLTQESYSSRLNRPGSKFAYFDFTRDEEPFGRLLIELYVKDFPRTARNFLALCTGENPDDCETVATLHYKGSPIHRIVPNGWIQGGDIVRGKGDSGVSIYGGEFQDESYSMSHDGRGIVGMANNGAKHTNHSQFYITFDKATWMDTKFVCFGSPFRRVVEGSDVLRSLEAIETNNERPKKEVLISDCGEFVVKF